MRPTTRILQLLCLGALAALGCASTTGTAPTPMQSASAEKKPSQQVTMQPAAAAASLAPVYFDTDQAVLRADARKDLEARAEAIVQHPEWGVVTIQGHCDERGSDEYNLALGDRRATVVKRYLIDLGVPPTRLGSVTYGESRPAVIGHDETAWRYNRRSELVKEALQSATR
jgi:peptidoglycan-associated lipoprotein